MAADGEAIRIGVDIGGTFTDVATEVDGRLHSTKVLTDHGRPDDAIVTGIRQVLAGAGIRPDRVGTVIHGTTLATNALLERRGARTAFVTTKGFRDVVEMRTESRFEQYDLDIVLPTPLVPRDARFVIDERIAADGSVLKAPDPTEIDRVCDRIAAGNFEAVAVGFIHSYVDGRHERLVRDRFVRRLPGVAVSISCEVSPQMREFPRFNTVCANAYVQPLMSSYLRRLVGRLREEGLACPIHMIHSGGGLMAVESAIEFPVRLLESGPAGGAIFAADVASRHGLDRVVSFDMGGTTAKISLIEDRVPRTAKLFEVARTTRFKKGSGMPVSIPVIEMVEIGAGGGSVAAVDGMRQIRVGPHSAGSEPGPACYGRGGSEPTVTDADLVLGRLDPDDFAGGAIRLSLAAAEAALERDVGRPLALGLVASAFGVSEVVDETMSNAARMHAVENGHELSDFTMIAFGGAAPVHAARLCDKLGIDALLVPPGAGVGSAIGFLRAPFGFESVRSAFLRLDRFDAGTVNHALQGLADEATAFVRGGAPEASPTLECTAFMRYVGQGWEVPVPVDVRRYGEGDAALFRDGFDRAYERQFGRLIDGLDVEIVSWSLRASVPVPPASPAERIDGGEPAVATGTRLLFDAVAETMRPAAIVARHDLRPGAVVAGPAVVTERETATVVTAGREAVMQADGCLLVRRRGRARP